MYSSSMRPYVTVEWRKCFHAAVWNIPRCAVQCLWRFARDGRTIIYNNNIWIANSCTVYVGLAQARPNDDTLGTTSEAFSLDMTPQHNPGKMFHDCTITSIIGTLDAVSHIKRNSSLITWEPPFQWRI